MLIVKNLMEDMVSKKLDTMLPQLGCCDCEVCKTDILCYSLNRLKPKYVATSQGELLSRIDSLSASFEIAIITEITQAAEIIKKHPRHEIKTNN